MDFKEGNKELNEAVWKRLKSEQPEFTLLLEERQIIKRDDKNNDYFLNPDGDDKKLMKNIEITLQYN